MCWTLGHHPKRLTCWWSYPNPYIPKIIPTSSRCGTICSTQIPTSNKESPLQAQLSSHWKIKCSIEIQLFTAWGCNTPYVKVPIAVSHSSTPRNRRAPITRSTTAKFLESPTLVSQGLIAPFCASGVGMPIAPLCHWGDLHRRTTPTHTTKFGAWL